MESCDALDVVKLYPKAKHPLALFSEAEKADRFVYISAPMVRYSKLAFRRTVYEHGTDLCFTPMILAKEFNRNQFARDSDLTISTDGHQPPTIVQFGSNSPLELSRAASLAAPFASGIDLNCGCPQSWACAGDMGAALMEKRELVRDMVVETRTKLARDGWNVALGDDSGSGLGRSVSVKIRVHKDLRKTIDFIDTVIGDPLFRNIDFLTIHPRTRYTQSTVPIFGESLAILTQRYGKTLPLVLSGDVFSLDSLPLSDLLNPKTMWQSPDPTPEPDVVPLFRPSTTKLSGIMSARGILANPALFAGHTSTPWSAVETFLRHAARAPLPLKLIQHHLGEMCGPGMGDDKHSLLSKAERATLLSLTNMCDVLDFMDDTCERKTGQPGGIARVRPGDPLDHNNLEGRLEMRHLRYG